jgi:hypothetical protein
MGSNDWLDVMILKYIKPVWMEDGLSRRSFHLFHTQNVIRDLNICSLDRKGLFRKLLPSLPYTVMYVVWKIAKGILFLKKST